MKREMARFFTGLGLLRKIFSGCFSEGDEAAMRFIIIALQQVSPSMPLIMGEGFPPGLSPKSLSRTPISGGDPPQRPQGEPLSSEIEAPGPLLPLPDGLKLFLPQDCKRYSPPHTACSLSVRPRKHSLMIDDLVERKPMGWDF